MKRLIITLLILHLCSTPAVSQQRKRPPKPAATNTTAQQKPAPPTLEEVLRALKSHVLLTGQYKTDKASYRVSKIDFDDCRFLFEVNYDSIGYNGKPDYGVSRYTSDFRYFTDQIVVFKEGLGKPTLVTLKTKEDGKLVLLEHTYQFGDYRRAETETLAIFQLAFEEKEAAEQASSLLRNAVKLCQAR